MARIVVANGRTARVVLRHAGGVGGAGGTGGAGAVSVGGAKNAKDSTWKEDQDHQSDKQPNASLPSSSGLGGLGRSSGAGGGDELGNKLAPSVSPYYFTIGSVESFERKLEQAQRELGINSRDFVPVQ